MAKQPKTNTDIDGYKYFRTRLTTGYDAKGKPIRKTFYGKSQKDAENKKREYEKALESGLDLDLGSQSLGRAMYLWLWEIEKHSGNKASSFERYESMYRNYVQNSQLGQLVVSDIKKLSVQRCYNEYMEQGKSSSLIKNLNKLLFKFFEYAVSESYILKNPLRGLKIPKESNEEDNIETFTSEEINKIINSLGNVKLRYVIMFAVLTGARMGEILALEKSDITGNMAKINKSIRTVRIFDDKENYHYEQKVTKPKTKGSIREIPLPKTLVEELKKLNILVKEERLKLGQAYTENNLLFPSLTGSFIDAKNLQRSWQRALINADVPYKKFHTLRHTYATKLFENGTSILTVSRLLGHSSIKTTEIYTHVLEEIKVKEVECLNNMFIPHF